MMMVPTTANTKVIPMALTCSSHSPPLATSLAKPFALAAAPASVILALPLFAVASTPVRNAPRVPPTACTPNVSNASSYPSQAFTLYTKKNGTSPAAMPMMMAPVESTKPQAGVITTSPATAPEQNPSTLGLPRNMYSAIAQTNDATAVAMVVVRNAFAATPSAATAEPALKPYQPTHSIPVPTMQSTMLCGGIGSLPNPRRLPRIMQRI